MTSEHVPVLIAGGGLAGLSAALFLGKQGIRSLVVERHSGTSQHPKARGFNARTMELLRGAGLESQVREAGADLLDNHDLLFFETLDQPPFKCVLETRDDGPTLRVSPTPACMCPQDALEPLLLAAARAHGAEVRFGVELEDFRQDENGVTATIGGQAVQADYLLACDGANGTIREHTGIAMDGSAPVFHSVGISFLADLSDLAPDPFILAFVTHPDAAGLLLPINNRDRWAFHVRFDPDRGQSAADFTAERCKELIRVATGRPRLAIELVSVMPWETTCLVADQFRQGRVFLAGDAAHLIPPAGAFGANTAIQDAHNLAWKLAFVLDGRAGPSLLDSYEAERRPVAEMTAEQALLRWQAWESRSGEEPFADDLTVIFGQRYVSGAIDDAGPAGPPELTLDGTPGTRAAHVWLDGTGEEVSTVDLFGPGFTLLHTEDEWAVIAKEASALLDVPIRCQQMDLSATYGVAREGAALVRPDGYVAWRTDTAGDDLAGNLARLLGR